VPPLELKLRRNQLELHGKLEAMQRVRVELGGLHRIAEVDPTDGSFAVTIPFAPGPVRVLIEGPATARQLVEVAGFSPARLVLARLWLLPGFALRLLRLAPVAWRWARHRDLAARIAVRDGLDLAPLALAQPLWEGIFSDPPEPEHSESAPLVLVMPVYNAFEMLREALARLERNTPAPWHLILIEDCSTDPQVRLWLRHWAARVNAAGQGGVAGQVELLENAENLGFIGAVNRGFQRALAWLEKQPNRAGAALVLLNSDAFVPENWTARLLAPIRADESVASVTPMSNDGEFLCVPFLSQPLNLHPGQAEQIDRLAAGLAPAPEGWPDMPTGVGFCMAISPNWLRRVGMFDPAFGAGYGEEVDWCQRARAMGARHVAQPQLFVEHRGGASFGTREKQRLLALNGARLSRRYPDFDTQVQAFIDDDPLLSPRLVLGLAWAASQARARMAGPVPVYLAHALGGGAEIDLERRIRADIGRVGAAVVLRVGAGLTRWQIELHGAEGKQDRMPTVTMGATSNAVFLKHLLELLPERRLIYSCGVGDRDPAGLPDLMLELGAAQAGGWEMLFHDYLPLSPSYTLLGDDGRFHGLPMPGTHPDRAHQARRGDGNIVDLATWRAKWGRLAAAADQLEVFSQSSRALVAATWPELTAKIRLAPHELIHKVDPVSVSGQISSRTRQPVIGVLGNINAHKGARELVALSRLLARNRLARLVVLGQLDPAFRLAHPALVHGRYAPADLADLVARYQVSAWLIPSIWPETFSFTTHESVATGLPVYAFDLGAQGDLVRQAAQARSDRQGGVIPITKGNPDLLYLLDQIRGLAATTKQR